MPAECSPPRMQFARLGGRAMVADFGGSVMTSDAGALLLGARDRAIGVKSEQCWIIWFGVQELRFFHRGRSRPRIPG